MAPRLSRASAAEVLLPRFAAGYRYACSYA